MIVLSAIFTLMKREQKLLESNDPLQLAKKIELPVLIKIKKSELVYPN